MTLYVIGLDEAGRSAVLRVEEQESFAGAQAPVRNDVWRGSTALADGATQPTYDVALPEGCALWRVVRMDPGRVDPVHQTWTLDFDVLLSGDLTLTLDVDEVVLTPGDAVLMPGVRHGWSVGSGGAVLSVFLVAMARGTS